MRLSPRLDRNNFRRDERVSLELGNGSTRSKFGNRIASPQDDETKNLRIPDCLGCRYCVGHRWSSRLVGTLVRGLGEPSDFGRSPEPRIPICYRLLGSLGR